MLSSFTIPVCRYDAEPCLGSYREGAQKWNPLYWWAGYVNVCKKGCVKAKRLQSWFTHHSNVSGYNTCDCADTICTWDAWNDQVLWSPQAAGWSLMGPEGADNERVPRRCPRARELGLVVGSRPQTLRSARPQLHVLRRDDREALQGFTIVGLPSAALLTIRPLRGHVRAVDTHSGNGGDESRFAPFMPPFPECISTASTI